MPDTNPFCSIIIISYDQEDFIEDAVRSAAEQDYDALEVVVSDDASRDATPGLIGSLEQRYRGRVRALLNDTNVGITRNSNRALRACRGAFIAYLGGDDILLPGKIAAQLEWFQQSSARVLCGHDVEYFDSATGRTLQLFGEASVMRSGRGVTTALRYGSLFPATAVMVRASAIPPWGFDERIPRISDYKLCIDCLLAGGHFGYVPRVLARYRVHPRAVTKTEAHECWVEAFMTLGIVEAEHPELARACASGRAYLYYRAGVAELQAGDAAAARTQFARALRSDPLYSTKLPLWALLSALPEPARRVALSFRGATRPHK